MCRLWSACEGSVLVEYSLIMPLFLVLMFGIIESGWALWTQTTLQYAVSAAARYAAICTVINNGGTCSPSVANYAASHAYGLSVPSGDFTFTSGASCGISGYTSGAQVTASYPFDFISIASLGPFILTATACEP